MCRNLMVALSLTGLAAYGSVCARPALAAERMVLAQEMREPNQALLRTVIGELQQGKPDYSQMQPELEQAVRQQMAASLAMLKRLGALKNITFLGEKYGSAVYKVDFENGETLWAIRLAPDGKIAGLSFRPYRPM